MEFKPFNETKFKHVAGEGAVAEFCNYMPRSAFGMRKWEIKARYEDGTCKIVVLRDSGFNISGQIVEVNPFDSLAGRNKEIYRLYHEERLSQIFLANLFNISQPSVSLIVNRKG